MVKINPKSILRFLPSLLWMVVIFYFSSRPTDVIGGSETFRTIFFKSLHLGEYAVLGALLFFGLKNKLSSVIFGYLYAFTDEFHQNFVSGRHCHFSDTLIDLLGIIIGVTLFKFVLKPLINKYNKKNKFIS